MYDSDLSENGLLIVTGSALKAEKYDRPLAYQLKSLIEEKFDRRLWDPTVLVLSDLWYLNAEPLQQLPMISIGGPRVNAVSARLFDKLPQALHVENKMLIQIDYQMLDLRACVWGANHQLTLNALQTFVRNKYLNRFLDAALARSPL